MKKLTTKNIRDAVKILRGGNDLPFPYFWIDNEHFYRSNIAKSIGFGCTEEEIEAGKLDENNFIKMANGVKLYLSKNIGVIIN